ncbi:MAG TPA: NUDIX hydrolase [Spirochaetia bacterium]|nr:NUDIX hydrolase [Spirochaetia bacterium]
MRITEERTLHSQKWTLLKEVKFLDTQGAEHSWTFIERTNNQKAVVIVPVTEESHSLILIRQFRVPFAREVVEFPAGLVDPGESPEATAVRELAEETGYRGTIEGIGPEVSTSAGITTETVTMVYMRVGEQPAAAQRLEGAERIEVMKVARENQGAFLQNMIEEGVLLDAKVYVYLQEHSAT